MTLKFFSNYDTPTGLWKRFLANYIINDKDLQFTIGEDYDFAIVFNQTQDYIIPTAKIITVIQEPSWSPAHYNTFFLLHSDYLVVHDRKVFEDRIQNKLGGKVIESASMMFYDDRVDHTFFDYAFHTPKLKKLSIIVSGLNASVGLYHKRIQLLKKILDSDLDIDIYGRRLNLNDARYKGELDYKFNGLLPYEYSIAIENSREKNYLTEKFVDCVMCNCVPIYYGAPNVNDLYDPRYFRHLDLESDHVIDQIREIISKPAPSTLTNKTMYQHQHNLYTKLKDITLAAN